MNFLDRNTKVALTEASPAGFYPFEIGDLHCLAISDGGLNVPTKMYAIGTPEQEWKAFLESHSQDPEMVPVQITALMVRSATRTILVDSGFGKLPGPTGKPMPTYGFVHHNLQAAGIEASAVDTVLVTHIHPDHIGGLFDEHGKAVFPNATYYASAEEVAYWSQDKPDQSGGMIKPETAEDQVHQAKRFIELAGHKLKTFPAGGPVLPGDGVTSLHLPGHTPGQLAYGFESKGETLMMMGDVWVHPYISLEHPDWRFAFDTDTPTAISSRSRATQEALDRKARCIVPHFPWPGLGRVGMREGRTYWNPDWYGWTHGEVAAKVA